MHAVSEQDEELFTGLYGATVRHLAMRTGSYVRRRGLEPEAVARYVLKVVESPNPRLRHPLGIDSRIPLALKRFLPFRVVEAIMARILTNAGYPAVDC